MVEILPIQRKTLFNQSIKDALGQVCLKLIQWVHMRNVYDNDEKTRLGTLS